MTSLFLTLAIAFPGHANHANLEPLQGTWLASDGARLVIDGDIFDLTDRDEISGFRSRIERFTPGRLALVDDTGRLTLPYRLVGDRLAVAGRLFRRER